MKSLLIQTFCLLFLCLGTVRAQQYQLASPNGKLSVTVDAGEALTWQIAHDGTTVLQPSAIALQGRDEKSAKKAITFGKNVKVIRAERKSVESSFPTPLYKKASVKDVYNQLTLKCRGGYSVQFRAYDEALPTASFPNRTSRLSSSTKLRTSISTRITRHLYLT